MIEEKEILDGINNAIKISGISVKELATKIDVPYRTLQKQLGGESRMSALALMRIFELFEMPSNYLFDEEYDLDLLALKRSLDTIFDRSMPIIQFSDDEFVLDFPKADNLSNKQRDEHGATLTALISNYYHDHKLKLIAQRWKDGHKLFRRKTRF